MSKELVTSARNGLALSSGSAGTFLAPESFGQVVEFAKDMSRAGTAIPKHLRDNPGACMAIAMQAFEWKMSPFAVANKSYSVNDRIAYEAQLIAAVVNTRSGIKGRLKYKFDGEGQNRRCTVTGVIDGDELEYTSPLFKDISPKNSPLWKSDPDQQHCYYSARAWARRHVPEVILGVYDREEVETIDVDPIDVTPPSPKIEKKETPTEDAEIIDQDPPSPSKDEKDFGPFASLGDYLEGLQTALSECQSEEDIEVIWTEFDPLAMLEGDDDSQEIAKELKAKHLVRLEMSTERAK